MTSTHNSTQFYVGGNMVLIRPLRIDEQIAKNTYNEIKDKFLSYGKFDIPPINPLSDYCGSTSEMRFYENASSRMVFVAKEGVDKKAVLGVALYVENQETAAHEYSVLVHPEYVSFRLAFELTYALAKDGAENGVRTLWTTESSENLQMAHIARDLDMSVRTDKYRQIRYSLQVDKHPDVVRVFSHGEHS